MNIRIEVPLVVPSPEYKIELSAPPQSSLYSYIKCNGSFGNIVFTRIDLAHTVVWIADYKTEQDIVVHGFSDQQLWQLYFPIPHSFDKTAISPSKSSGIEYPIYLSATEQSATRLPASNSRIFFIHYMDPFFEEVAGESTDLREVFGNLSTGMETITKATPVVLSIIQQIIHASPNTRFSGFFLEAKVKELLVMLYQLRNPANSLTQLSEKEVDAVQQARNIIMNNLTYSYSSYELSKLTGSNVHTLKRNFRTWFGIPLHHFLHSCRMEKSTSLLLQTQDSIKEVAFAVGYKNVSNFSEAFKKHYGYPPSSLRETA